MKVGDKVRIINFSKEIDGMIGEIIDGDSPAGTARVIINNVVWWIRPENIENIQLVQDENVTTKIYVMRDSDTNEVFLFESIEKLRAFVAEYIDGTRADAGMSAEELCHQFIQCGTCELNSKNGTAWTLKVKISTDVTFEKDLSLTPH